MLQVALKQIHWVKLFLLILSFAIFSSSKIHARPTIQIEQQFNLITAELSTTSTTPSPTDNSLGLFLYDADKFNGEAVYFEAVFLCNACVGGGGGNPRATVALYTDAGTVVTNSTLNTTSTNYIHVRSSNIASNLTNGEEYSVRLTLNATQGTAFLRTARLVVLQSASTITDTQSQIELGNTDTTTNTSYELITAPKIFFWDDDVFSGVQNVYFEATQRSSLAIGVASTALSSSTTCASTVTGSEVTVTNTTWARSRSANILSNLTDDTDYWVCVKASAAATSSISTAKLIIEQTDAGGLHNLQLIHPLVNAAVTDADSTYTSQNFIYLYDPGIQRADNVYRYFDATLQSSLGTDDAFVRLYNASDSANIVSGELSTPSTGYTRLRTSDLSANMPSSVKTLDVQLKNESTATTTVSNAWLIYNVVRQPDPTMTFSLGSVSAGAVNNAITTSVGSTYNTLPFGNLTFNTPKYAAHALSVTTNASDGYSVTVELASFIQGLYPGNNIDPFAHPWATPAVWAQPTGSTPNDNTGWFGANTTDTRIANWVGGEQKFGAITDSPQIVMYSGSSDNGTTAYVTYALEVNVWQPADQYQGTLVYNVLPIY